MDGGAWWATVHGLPRAGHSWVTNTHTLSAKGKWGGEKLALDRNFHFFGDSRKESKKDYEHMDNLHFLLWTWTYPPYFFYRNIWDLFFIRGVKYVL